ncbi:MAG: flagellar protein FliS [Lachnospiraceae bacterium]|nr:flagellar protein FliS [Lachnospiraceae bacterium]
MDTKKFQEYSARITQASRSQLVVITFEIIIESIRDAMVSYNKNDIAAFQKELNRGKLLINEKIGALDMQYDISKELFQIYEYCGRMIAEAFVKGTSAVSPKLEEDKLNRVISIMERLKSSFEQVAKQDESGPVMKNTQKLYAGLTYSRKSLNEVFVNVNEASRGFKA